MKKLIATVAMIAAVTIAIVLVTGGASASSRERAIPQGADVAALHDLQASFHHAVSGGGHLDEQIALWAPDATFTVAGGTIVLHGRDEIIDFFDTHRSAPTAVSLAPSWKTEITVHGTTAVIYFECHFVNLATGMLVAPPPLYAGGTFEGTAVKIAGEWFFKDIIARTAPLTPAP